MFLDLLQTSSFLRPSFLTVCMSFVSFCTSFVSFLPMGSKACHKVWTNRGGHLLSLAWVKVSFAKKRSQTMCSCRRDKLVLVQSIIDIIDRFRHGGKLLTDVGDNLALFVRSPIFVEGLSEWIAVGFIRVHKVRIRVIVHRVHCNYSSILIVFVFHPLDLPVYFILGVITWAFASDNTCLRSGKNNLCIPFRISLR